MSCGAELFHFDSWSCHLSLQFSNKLLQLRHAAPLPRVLPALRIGVAVFAPHSNVSTFRQSKDRLGEIHSIDLERQSLQSPSRATSARRQVSSGTSALTKLVAAFFRSGSFLTALHPEAPVRQSTRLHVVSPEG
eukprot:27333-Amphidinium_carterae.1